MTGLYASNVAGTVTITSSQCDDNAQEGIELQNVNAGMGAGGVIENSTITDNGLAGIRFVNVNRTGITNSTITRNGAAASALNPDDGIVIESGTGNEISANTICGNTGPGHQSG